MKSVWLLKKCQHLICGNTDHPVRLFPFHSATVLLVLGDKTPERDFAIDQEEEPDTSGVTGGISGMPGSSHGEKEELFLSAMVTLKHRLDLDLTGRVGTGDVDEAVLDGGGVQGGDLVKGDDRVAFDLLALVGPTLHGKAHLLALCPTSPKHNPWQKVVKNAIFFNGGELLLHRNSSPEVQSLEFGIFSYF